MADDAANEDAAPASGEDAVKPDGALGAPVPPSGSGPSLRRTLTLCLALVAPVAVIALGIFFMVRGGTPREAASMNSSAPAASAAPPPASDDPASVSDAPALEKAAAAVPAFDEEGNDEQPSPTKRHAAPKHFATVQQAAAGSCSTESVDGLSRQIIDQARCIEPNAFVALPKRPNLVLASHVFPYLEQGAREHLVRALDAHTAATMTINSALRTVAQQYLVWHWGASKSCGVQLATPPGESNHEIGVALDIAEAAKWRPALEAQEFHWLGTSDRVHFDYKGGNASPHNATDVLAFQKLWNKNHAGDAIPENGQYGPATEERLKKAPPGGFPLGPSCHGAGARKH